MELVVNEIPKNWRKENLGRIAKIRSGESPSSFNISKEGIPYFKVEQLNNSAKYAIETPYYIEIKNPVPSGSIVFPKRGESINQNKIRICTLDSFFDTNLMALTIDNSFDSEFIYYYLMHVGLDRIADITSIPQINNKHIIPFPLIIPTFKEEQTAIANTLSDTDSMIQSLEKLIEKKKQIKEGVMQELLTGLKRLGGFSSEWVEKSIGELFNIHGGVSASRNQLSESGTCYLHYGDIHGSNSQFIDVVKEKANIPKLNIEISKVSQGSFLKDGDIVFVDASEDDEGVSRHLVIRNSDDEPFITGLHTIRATSKDESLSNSFKEYCFQSSFVKDQFRFYAVGTKVFGISKTNIKKIRLKFPSDLEEQNAIGTALCEIDKELLTLEHKKVKLEALKQAMMQQLLTGKIRLE